MYHYVFYCYIAYKIYEVSSVVDTVISASRGISYVCKTVYYCTKSMVIKDKENVAMDLYPDIDPYECWTLIERQIIPDNIQINDSNSKNQQINYNGK